MLKADLHVHTLASDDAINTVYELVEEAKKKGVKMIGICDHSPYGIGGPSLWHFLVTSRRVKRKIKGVEVIWGVEADILDENGKLGLSDEILKHQELVLASVHPEVDLKSGLKECSFDPVKGMIRAMRNPLVDIVAHPYVLVDEKGIKLIVKVAAKLKVPLELNNSYLVPPRRVEKYYPRVLLMTKLAKEKGLKLFVGSDAHAAWELGSDEGIRRVLKEANFGTKDIVNWTVKQAEKFLKNRRRSA